MTESVKEEIKTQNKSNPDIQEERGNERTPPDAPEVDSLSALLEERDQLPAAEKTPKEAAPSKEAAPQKANPKSEEISPSSQKAKAESKIGETPKLAENAKTPDDGSAFQSLKEELEKTQKRLTENQHYGRQNAQRLKNALKIAKEFVEEGSLSEEEATRLIGSLEQETSDDETIQQTHPFSKVLAVANKELENIRKYTEDASLDDKVAAFDYFLLTAAQEDRDQALEELTDLSDNPIALAKKMLSLGQSFETSYKEMKEAGSLHGVLVKKEKEIADLRKSIDKLTQKLAQYEDYDKPRYRLDERGETDEAEPDQDSISALFASRDRVVYKDKRASL